MIKIRLYGTLEEIEETTRIIREQFDVLSESKPYADRGESECYRCYMDCEVIFNMFNVYEVYTWDDVSYTKVSSFIKKEDAEKEAERLKAERRSLYGHLGHDPVSYCVMSDSQYYRWMHND